MSGVPIIVIATFGQPLFRYAGLRLVLRVCGVLYLLWLAWRLTRKADSGTDRPRR